jgi:hypothetical protein
VRTAVPSRLLVQRGIPEPIAGEDVVEEPPAEQPVDAIPGYDEEARIQYVGGLSEDTGEGTLAE